MASEITVPQEYSASSKKPETRPPRERVPYPLISTSQFSTALPGVSAKSSCQPLGSAITWHCRIAANINEHEARQTGRIEVNPQAAMSSECFAD
jgi:hypothetical protein